MSTIGQRVEEARKGAGLNASELAARCKVTPAAISQIESGQTKSPKPETLFAIADATKVNARWIVTGKGEKLSNGLSQDDVLALVDADDLYDGLTKLNPESKEYVRQMILTALKFQEQLATQADN